MPKTTTVSELKAHLSRFLRRVKAGEEVLVTERNVAVARIVPVAPAAPERERLRELERQGLVKIGSGRLPRNFWSLPRGRDAAAHVRSAVAEEREEGW